MTRPFVPTVLGPLDPQELGPTLTHEHLLTDWPRGLGLVPPLESTPIIDRILTRLEKASKAGVSGLVDMGTELFGPSPLLLLHIASRTPIHILASTGCFTADMLPRPAWAYPPAGPEEIAQRFIQAATDGVGRSGVKPAVIKIGTSGRAISEIEETIFRAACLAQRATGLAILTHTHFSRLAIEQADLLADAGADLDRVVIGHIGWGSTVDDLEMHVQLAERGVTLGLDCVGTPARTNEEYARMAADLIQAGFSSRIVFSHDAVAFSRGLLEFFSREWLTGDFSVIHTGLLPLLREAGISDSTISEILVENPARILTVDPQRYPGSMDTILRPVTADPFAPFDYRGAVGDVGEEPADARPSANRPYLES